MITEIPRGVVDVLGQQLEVGDKVAAALTIGRSAELRVGTIAGYSESKPSYEGQRPTPYLQVTWERSSLDAAYELRTGREKFWTYGPAANKATTRLQIELMKFVKL